MSNFTLAKESWSRFISNWTYAKSKNVIPSGGVPRGISGVVKEIPRACPEQSRRVARNDNHKCVSPVQFKFDSKSYESFSDAIFVVKE